MSAPLCDTCEQPLELAVWLNECELDTNDDGAVVIAVGRLDRLDFVCLNGHVQADPPEALRVTGISADREGVFIARAELRP